MTNRFIIWDFLRLMLPFFFVLFVLFVLTGLINYVVRPPNSWHYHAGQIVMLSLSKHLLVGREGYWRFFARCSE